MVKDGLVCVVETVDKLSAPLVEGREDWEKGDTVSVVTGVGLRFDFFKNGDCTGWILAE